MGRTSFDKNEGDGGWDDGGPLGDTPASWSPITSRKDSIRRSTRSSPTAWPGDQAGQAKAGDKNVGLFGATVMQQALPLGLVDENRVHVIPVLLGGGTPLFARLDSAISLQRTQWSRPPPRRTWDSVSCISAPPDPRAPRCGGATVSGMPRIGDLLAAYDEKLRTGRRDTQRPGGFPPRAIPARDLRGRQGLCHLQGSRRRGMSRPSSVWSGRL